MISENALPPSYEALQQRVREVEDELLERRETEENLRTSEEKYRLLAETATEMIILCDMDRRIVYINRAGLILGGYQEAEILGKPIHRLLEGAELQQNELLLQAAAPDPHGRELWDASLHCKDGHVLPIEVIAAPVIKHGFQQGVLLTARDISARRSMEEELLRAKKLESIGVLAGGIAHDYNNLLTAMMGYITLAESVLDSNEEAKALLGRARHAAVMAKNLSRKLITFSRGGKPMRKPGQVLPLLENALSFALAGSNVECEFRIPPDLWPVEYDESQMSQAIHNIVINAREAMPQGGTLRVRADNLQIPERNGYPVDPGEWVRITIEDEGVGISEEYLDKIFDPYFTTKEMGAKKGLGLGLAISHSVVRNHQGYLFAESEPTRGTAFHLYLPIAKRSGPSRDVSSGTSPERDGTIRVLIMDDEEIVRDITQRMLERTGCEVSLAREGAEAVAMFRRRREEGNPFHVVLLDLTVRGGMSGKEAVRELKAIEPNVKAIVSSGYADDPVLNDFGAYGFTAAVTKPYSMDELRRTIRNVTEAAG
ncbi:MAG: PAS domain S-box protein [Deltaproteobacteria bacterium]|nr:PAS domain S-box protein [Deltaproteobacteria bacterium]